MNKKEKNVAWCFNADMLDYFEDATKATIKPNKLKLVFATMNDTEFENTAAGLKSVVQDTIEIENNIDIKTNPGKKSIIIKYKES